MKPDTKNYYLALLLSVFVVFGWNYFYGKKQLDHAKEAQVAASGLKPGDTGAPGSLPPQTVNAPPQGGPLLQTPVARRTRREVLAQGPRVPIDTPALQGSIALTGGRLDDLSLKDYRETSDKNSPLIELLTPHGAPEASYVDAGFVPQGGVSGPVPSADTVWTKTAGDELTPATPVTLTYDNGQGLVFTRTFAVDKDYMFTVTQGVANHGGAAVTLVPYSTVTREGMPRGSGHTQVHEGFIGYVGDAEQQITYAKIEKETGATAKATGQGGWAGFTDMYWATALVPDQGRSFEADYSAFGATEKTYRTAVIEQPLAVPAGGEGGIETRVFAGAKVSSLLTAYENAGIKKFDLLIDWGKYIWWLTQPMAKLLVWLDRLIGNMGLAIIALTFLVKLVFFPLANRSYVSMAKMKAAQPQLAALKERFPDDKMRQQQEMMKIYKAEKINPVAGCVPMVIQIPVFFALYSVLFISIEMRQAPFVLWIRDLSQPDPTNIFNLFGLIPYNPTTLPLIGPFLAIGIFPVVMGISMFLQMKMNPEPTDPVQKQMFAYMPVIFTFMLGSFPSGLVVYWTTNNTLTLIQQSVIMKRSGVKLELFDNLRAMFRRKAPKDDGSPAMVARSKSDVAKIEAANEGGTPAE